MPASHFRIGHKMRWNDQMDIVNVFYATWSDGFSPSGTQWDGYMSTFYGALGAVLPATLVPQEILVSAWEGDPDGVWWDDSTTPGKPKKLPPWGVEQVYSSTVTFDGEGECLPPSVAMFAFAKTGVKHVIARKFIGPVREADQANGILIPTTYTALLTSAAHWMDCFSGVGGPVGQSEVWGYKHGFTPLASSYASDILATNRRRRIGRGS